MSKTMTKRVGFVRRRPDMSPEQFQRHWLTVHADLCKQLPRAVIRLRGGPGRRPEQPRGQDAAGRPAQFRQGRLADHLGGTPDRLAL